MVSEFLVAFAAGLLGSGTEGSFAVPCAYYDRKAQDIVSETSCGWLNEDGLPDTSTRQWKRLKFDAHGLTSVRIGDSWYWLNRSGRAAPTMLFDNWAEDFNDGLVRSPRGDKIGYMDRSFNLVIPAIYDGALPFKNGVAPACRGCTVEREGEHTLLMGGEWVCVDTRGVERKRDGQSC